ncbi:hypothetical protein [Nocardia sp. NPDC004260]
MKQESAGQVDVMVARALPGRRGRETHVLGAFHRLGAIHHLDGQPDRPDADIRDAEAEPVVVSVAAEAAGSFADSLSCSSVTVCSGLGAG